MIDPYKVGFCPKDLKAGRCIVMVRNKWPRGVRYIFCKCHGKIRLTKRY
jgi:hypothetical protein